MDGGRREAFAGLVAQARPGLLLPQSGKGRDELSEPLLDGLRRLAGLAEEAGEIGRLDYIRSLREHNDRLVNENRRLVGLTAADPEVLRQLADGFEVKHWAVKLLAFGFSDYFRSSGAKNFLTVDLFPQDMPPLTVTMQVKDGASPADRIAALESEIAELRLRLRPVSAP
jgi:hypothetical protein